MNLLEKDEDKVDNRLYGIGIWDQDIGFGTRDDGIFEDYECFCSGSDTSSSEEPATPPASAEKKVILAFIIVFFLIGSNLNTEA